jgi:hypothetical protein
MLKAMVWIFFGISPPPYGTTMVTIPAAVNKPHRAIQRLGLYIFLHSLVASERFSQPVNRFLDVPNWAAGSSDP